MEGEMDGQTLYYRNHAATARFQKNLQNKSRIKGTYYFWPNLEQHGQTRILLDKKNNILYMMCLWSSLVKKAAKVDIKKTKHM